MTAGVHILPSVLGSSRKTSRQSTKLVPLNGSPPMPTHSVWPSPVIVVWWTASYVRVPDRDTMPIRPRWWMCPGIIPILHSPGYKANLKNTYHITATIKIFVSTYINYIIKTRCFSQIQKKVIFAKISFFNMKKKHTKNNTWILIFNSRGDKLTIKLSAWAIVPCLNRYP